MASLRIDSVCCQFKENMTLSDPHVNMNLHYTIYNSLCLISATVSILGSIYQVFPRGSPVVVHRTGRGADSVQRQTYIINWLAVADLLASIAILVRAAVWLGGYGPSPNSSGVVDGRHIFCAAISGWIQFCYNCTYFWTICYAIDVYKTVHEKPGCGVFYHIFGWVIPGLLCLVGLLPFYTPNLTQCGTELRFALPHLLVTYVPIVIVMVGNPILYYLTQREVQATLRSRGLYTNQERQILKGIQTKFLLVMLVFYVCWTANIMDGILMIFSSRVHLKLKIGVWHFMALTNPLQSFLNSLVYRGVGGCRCCCPSGDRLPLPPDIQAGSHHLEESSEVSPLLSFRKSGHHSGRSSS